MRLIPPIFYNRKLEQVGMSLINRNFELEKSRNSRTCISEHSKDINGIHISQIHYIYLLGDTRHDIGFFVN